jgi:hypothetical protein
VRLAPRIAPLLVLLAACDPVWQIRAKVTDPAGAPVPGAALAITCPRARGLAALTDEHGEAAVGNLGWQLPAGCTLTVAKPGQRTFETTTEAMCAPSSLDHCARVRDLDVVLSAE